MGKRAAPLAGERVSPIIAARGGGNGWNIAIENAGGYDHDVELGWDNGTRDAGTLAFQPTSGGSSAPIVLRGTIDAKALTVELLRQACRDGDGVAHEHALVVTIAGRAPMRGCADLAI